MRITGLGSGLDMDQIVKDSMKPHRIKMDQTKQKRDILEIKQQLYRDVINDSREFYNKYLDIAKSDSLLLSKNWSTTTFESSNSSAVSVTGVAGTKVGNYKVTVDQLATPTKATLKIDDLNGVRDPISVVYNGKTVDIDINGLTSEKDIAKKLNTELSKMGMKAAYSEFAKGIVIETVETGSKIKADGSANTFVMTDGAGTTVSNKVDGKDLKATIVGENGTIVYDENNILGKNKTIIDGIEFSFNDLTTAEVRITGKTDTKASVDKIVSFVNDYNVLMEKLSIITSEKRNKNYMPLTEEQKKEMSESEIKLWNEKTKQGQLNRDSDITRIVSSMKESMTSVFGASLNPESIGINPVKEYGTKNGTFTVDVDKLTKSLENNAEEVMSFFIATPPEGTPESEKSSKTGILQKLKNVIYKETFNSSSMLIKKAGVEGTPSAILNQLTKNMEEYNKKMDYMEKDFARREQALYSKYAKLEVALNKYNSQQSAMEQQFGAN